MHKIDHIRTLLKDPCSPCQSLVDYGNLKGPSMRFIINWDQLGSVAVAACFPWGKQHKFPMGKKSHWDNKVEKNKNKKKRKIGSG